MVAAESLFHQTGFRWSVVRVRWLAAAAQGRRDQLEYVAKRNAQAAIDIGDKLRAATRLLGRHPLIGRAGRRAGTREWVVAGTPFLIVYRVEDDIVTILRLFHGAQDRTAED